MDFKKYVPNISKPPTRWVSIPIMSPLKTAMIDSLSWFPAINIRKSALNTENKKVNISLDPSLVQKLG